MMKKTILALTLVLAGSSLAANDKLRWGVAAGANTSLMSQQEMPLGLYSADYRPCWGLHAGGMAEWAWHRQWSVHSSLLLIYNGGRLAAPGRDITSMAVSQLQLPAHLKYSHTWGQWRGFAMLGAYTAVTLAWHQSGQGGTHFNPGLPNSHSVQRWEAGISSGLGVEYKKVSLSAAPQVNLAGRKPGDASDWRFSSRLLFTLGFYL